MNLPVNAQQILDARMKGFKPADMVIVSLVGPVGMENPTVFAKASKHYDWRWVRDLDLCLYFTDEDDWPALVKEIALHRPEHLNLWNHAGQWGAAAYLIPTADDVNRPVRNWKYELDFMPWMDFQNKDFIECRMYQRDNNGVPYAVNH
jgi:hypothetical protein